MIYFMLIGGLLLLLIGAEIMLKGAIGLADKFNLSKLVIGLTVVAFGTSAPEFVVSLNAVLSGSPGLAIGNLIGSNIANILLVLAIAGLITPIIIQPRSLKEDGYLLLGGTVLFSIIIFFGDIKGFTALILISYFVFFISYSFFREKAGVNTTKQQPNSVADEIDGAPNSLVKIILYLIIGFTGLIFGSDFLVTGGVGVARVFGISEAVIGLTIVAFGTSLPELAATAVAAYRKHSDVALGNLVGSNIFNIIGIVGVVSLISPMEVPQRIIEIDLWVMLAATLILMPFMIGNKKVFGRTGASLFLLCYIFYIGAVGYGIGNFN